jgi:D-alanyl-D-alanine carboxypeptidase (penicillin-binding protein 5/6)
MKKLVTIISLVCILLVTFKIKLNAEEVNIIHEDYQLAKSAILIEASTNKVLVDENSKIRLHMASMTKVMSLLLFFEAIEE